MKHILIFLLSLILFASAKAQFPGGTDTLRRFNNRFIDNDAKKAFTNLRLHNLLAGIIDQIDSASGGGSIALGLDTLWAQDDSTLIYRKNGLFYTVIVRGATGAGPIYRVPFSDGAHLTNDSNFLFDKSQGADASRLIAGPITVTTGGLAKINATSDNMNALGLTSYGTGLNTIIFKRARGAITAPTKLLSGDDLFNLAGRGFNGTDWVTTSKAAIYAQTVSDWAPDSTGARILFRTTNIDSVNAYDRLLIEHNGHIGINDLSPEYGLTVNRSVGINKDSIPIVGSITSESVLLVDTINWRINRVNLSVLDKNIAEDDLSANGSHTHNFHGYDQLLDSLGDCYIFSRGQRFGKKQRSSIALLADQSTPMYISAAMMQTNGIFDSITAAIQVNVDVREFTVGLSDGGSGASSRINFRAPATGISRLELLGDTVMLSSGQILLNEYTPASAYVKTDTTTVKPIVIDSYGNIWRMAGWPGVPFSIPTLQQVLTSGSTLTTDHSIVLADNSLSISSINDFGTHHFNIDETSGVVQHVVKNGNDSAKIQLITEDVLAEMLVDGSSNNVKSSIQANQSGTVQQSQSNLTGSSGIFSTDTSGFSAFANRVAGSVNGSNTLRVTADYISMDHDSSAAVKGNLRLLLNKLPSSTNMQDSILVKGTGNFISYRASPQSFAQTATATVSATGTETTLISSGAGSLVVPSSDWVIGKTYEVKIHGYLDTDGSNPAQFNFRLKLGSTTIAATGNMSQGAGVSDRTFEAVITFTARTVSSSGTIFTMGHFINDNDGINKFDNGTSTSTLDMTGSLTLDLTVQMSDGSAGNNANVSVLTFRAIN